MCDNDIVVEIKMSDKATRTKTSLVYNYFDTVLGKKTGEKDKSKGHKRRKQEDKEEENQPPTKKTICKLKKIVNTSRGKEEVQCEQEFVVSLI